MIPMNPLLKLAIALALLIAPSGAHAGRINLYGANDSAVDRPALQEAIDAAAEGDTLVLHGDFQLDGVTLTMGRSLRLQGVRLDNDLDGAVNEDWLDQVDNDGDGQVDEDGWDATLHGVLDEFGRPLPEIDRTVVFNRAIFVRGLQTTVRNLVIRDLRFTGHFRALTLEPDTGSTGGTVCENLFSTSGALDNLRILRNRFDNNDRAIELEGRTHRAVIAHNRMESTGEIAIIAEGDEQGCPLLGGGFSTFPIGVPVQTAIRDNELTANQLIGIFVKGSEATGVVDNVIEGGAVGVFAQDDLSVRIQRNEIVGASFAMDLLGPVGSARVERNRVNGGFFGIVMELGASGWLVRNNEFSDVLIYELLLDPSTTGNTLWVGVTDRVEDGGVDNTIIVR